MIRTPSDCREVFRRLDDYLDRELAAGEMENVRLHLLDCTVCAREFTFEETWIRRLRHKLRRIDVPADLKARIRRALDQATAP